MIGKFTWIHCGLIKCELRVASVLFCELRVNTEKSLRNHSKITQKITKRSLKSFKNHKIKSCDFKITKVTYTILTGDLPLA